MRIAFYCAHPYWGGLNNNGGSRTILLSADILRAMGHTVDVVTMIDHFTWFDHPRPVQKIPHGTDVVVAVSISDLAHLVFSELAKDCLLTYWARPAETWQMDKKLILNTLRAFTKRKGRVFVNSEWQEYYFNKHGIHSRIVYAGLDLDQWNENGRVAHDKTTIGFLVSVKKRKRFVDLVLLVDLFGDKFNYIGYGEKNDQDENTDDWIKYHPQIQFFVSPNKFTMLNIYQSCDIWFAPTALEGFHNPPTEANLCGAMVVCSDARKAGVSDYANNETAVVYHDPAELVETDFVRDNVKVKAMQELLRTKIGTRQTNMQRMVEMMK